MLTYIEFLMHYWNRHTWHRVNKNPNPEQGLIKLFILQIIIHSISRKGMVNHLLIIWQHDLWNRADISKLRVSSGHDYLICNSNLIFKLLLPQRNVSNTTTADCIWVFHIMPCLYILAHFFGHFRPFWAFLGFFSGDLGVLIIYWERTQ